MQNELVIGNPYTLQFNLLTDCIFKCNYCYLNEIKRNNNKRLSYLSYKHFLDKFKDYFKKYNLTLRLNITGGDIWFHPEISKIMKYTYSLPYIEDMNLLINNLWDKKSKELILCFKDKIGLVQLNIDSLNNRAEDTLFLENNNIRIVVKILISKNKKYLDNQIKILNTLRKRSKNLLVSIDRLCPANKSQIKEVLSSPKEMLDEINKIRDQNIKLFITDDPLISSYLKLSEREVQSVTLKTEELFGCLIPNGGLTIYPDGSIKLCARIPSFNTGFNINNFDLLSYITKFTKLSNEKKKDCKDCRLYSYCQGGCPATSFIANGNKISRDLSCLKDNIDKP